MAERSFPFDAGPGGTVLENEWGQMAQWWLSPGVLIGYLNSLSVFADSSGKQVKIRSGTAWAYGTYYTNDAEFTLGPFPDNTSGNPRIDRVVVRFDWGANTAALTLLGGTPAASPVPPALETTPGVKWDLTLAQVAIANGYTTIAAGNVTDERYNAAPRIHDFIQGHSTGGLTAGQHLRATGSSTMAFGATQLGDLPAIPAARVYHNANQSVADSTWTTLALNSERFDTDTIHDTVTNNTRLTAKTAGKYLITAVLEYATSGTGVRYAEVLLNGSTSIAFAQAVASAFLTGRVNITTVYAMATNDYIEIRAYQDSGGALNVLSSAQYSPEVMIARVGT